MYNSFQHDISPNSFADNFHVYEIRWDVGYIGWYVDNVLIHQITPSVFLHNIAGLLIQTIGILY